MGSSSSVQSGAASSSTGGASSPGGAPVLYIYPFSAPCRAVLMAAGAAGIRLDVRRVDLLTGEHLQPTLLEINPDHTVPTLVDGSLHLWESRAIMQYLMNKHGGVDPTLYPRDPAQRALVDRMLQYDLSVVYKSVSEYAYPQLFNQQSADEERARQVEKVLDYLENILKRQPFVAGAWLTLADLSIIADLSVLEAVGWSLDRWSAVCIWRETLRKHSWYQEANSGLTRYLHTKQFSMD